MVWYAVAQLLTLLFDLFSSRSNQADKINIMIEAGKSIGSKTIEQEAIPTYAVIENSDRLGCGIGLQVLCEEVGPAIVRVRSGAMAIGDGVAQNNNRASSGRSNNVDTTYEVPVLHLLRIRKIRCRDLVTVCDVRGRTGTWMSGLLCGWLVEVKSDR